MKHVFRMHRGDDLYLSLEAYASAHDIKAALILSGVGSVSELNLRAAGAKRCVSYREDMEIVSLTGTVSRDRIHVHGSFSREDMSCVGGHLKPGAIVNTTAEIVLDELEGVVFSKEYDPETGYDELAITYER